MVVGRSYKPAAGDGGRAAGAWGVKRELVFAWFCDVEVG